MEELMNKNQIEQSDFIKTKFSKYLRSTFDIRDSRYNDLYNKRLDELESKLYKGPYLASSLPFEQSSSINELIDKGEFEKDFLRVGALDFDRPCYAHQINAFKRVAGGHNIVVTTGTGSGKTECFMLPIINELIKEINNGDTETGVRAIFLFPLNALVYDQIDRLRELLKNYEEIKFGFYTGRTPEDETSVEGRKQVALYKKQYGEPSKNEFITRDKMRANPPHILFTNYSMLEYLLIRPTDQSLISADALKHLRFIVLDEAHIYRGALGIEISLLISRLKGTANKKPQFILTSATLGRGEEDLPSIIDFASKLTSSPFEDSDIIFGIRHQNNEKLEYRVKPEDCLELYNCFDDKDNFIKVYEKYRAFDERKSIKTNTYELLIRDYNSNDLFHYSQKVGGFMEVMDRMFGFNIETLTALIELISKSTSDDSDYPKKLFDIKYHMFMKAPDGAFVTLGSKKDLSLVTVNQINDNKAFKIGICQNCKVPYVMGITEANILRIDDEIDIDESYADKAKRLEYYLIGDSLTPDEIVDLENNKQFEKYYVCSACGFIKKASSAVATSDCEHFASSKTTLYKFIGKDDSDIDEDDVITNNLHRCPICDYKSTNGGVIMGFHVGKDRATTLIAQILYESMNYPTKKIAASKDSLFGGEEKTKKLRKQYLVFSDSRQQAAYFSKFLNSMNDRFMKKSIIWDLLKENDHQKIPYLSLVAQLDSYFRERLYYTDEEAIKHAKATALWELLLVDGRNSGEGIGLFAFKLDLNKGNYKNEELLEKALASKGFNNITAKQFKDITAQALSVFRTSPSISYDSLLTDNPEERKELLGYRQRSVYISLQEARKAKSDKNSYYPVKSFLPVEDDSTKKSAVNNVVKYVMKTLDYDVKKAKDLLRIIFQLAIDEKILTPNEAPEYDGTYLIKASEYTLHSYKNLKYYKCSKCNKLTLYNVNNKCTDSDCNGLLEECDVDNDDFYKNNYYRNEYISRSIEKLICREHTAQMNADEAKKIQDDFKSETGKTNFISCSTTFEMGIDLGGLNTVFMRNVPPTPSNYAQRAGRAGRRAETSAFILTFCGSTSHDYTYFSAPQEMIRGLVKPPYFVIDNDKILMRHITATALSLYFREPEYLSDFDTVEHFLKEEVADKFLNYIRSKPKKLGDMIDKYLLNSDELLCKYGDFKWINYLELSESALRLMNDGLKNLIQLYTDAMNYASSTKDFPLANSYKEALRRLNSKNSLITNFTKYNVIPGYGFPVDNVELHIYDYDEQKMSDEYNLSRDLSLAISEYAPGSEIIVNEKKYTSRYLFLPHKGYSLPATYYLECEKCHTINTHVDKNYFIQGVNCKYCETPINVSKGPRKFVTPIFGFVADKKNKDTKRMKPFKTYASDTFYIGDNLSTADELNNTVEISEHNNEELLVLNESKFYTCESCGYTDLDKKYQFDSKIKAHNEYQGKSCNCGGKLKLVHLGHSYRTDIIRVSFKDIPNMFEYDTAISVLFAVLEGISMTYEIERNDIGGIAYSSSPAKPYELLLFDTVSGGAGHVKRLKDDSSLMEVLRNALKKVSQDCCGEDTSCYNCLRTYNNQRLHKHIKRGLAKEALSLIVERILDEKKQYTISLPKLPNYEVAIENGLIGPDESIVAFKNLIDELSRIGAPMPDGFGYSLTPDDGSKKEFADFAWKSKNILLFSIARQESYYNLIDTQNRYKCYLLSNALDYVSVAKEVN